jgi:hypothetical protein
MVHNLNNKLFQFQNSFQAAHQVRVRLGPHHITAPDSPKGCASVSATMVSTDVFLKLCVDHCKSGVYTVYLVLWIQSWKKILPSPKIIIDLLNHSYVGGVHIYGRIRNRFHKLLKFGSKSKIL